jgi:5-formyltetrahydrofolate cyclo-ligase
VTGHADLSATKAALRTAAHARRAGLPDPARDRAITTHLTAFLASTMGTVSGYWPMRSEVDIRPALAALAATRTVALPVVLGRAQPLLFRAWTPATALVPAAFGTQVPPDTAPVVVPQVLLIPLLAFDPQGWRLGYGGGFYDRTLARLRPAGPVLAIGVAYAGQQVDHVPHDPTTDARLDAMVTEDGVTPCPPAAPDLIRGPATTGTPPPRT